MLPRLRLPMLALAALLSFTGCAATTEEDDSMEAEGATRVTPDWIAAEREQIFFRYAGRPLYAKLLVEDEGKDWEIVESAPWLAPLPKPTAKLQEDRGKRFRVFEWDSRKLPVDLYGVTFRKIDAATKKPVLDERREFVTADAIVVFGGADKTITVTSEMPAQTIPVPSGWLLEMKLPKVESGYGWKLQTKEGGPLVDPSAALAFEGFEPAEENHAKADTFRVRTATSQLDTPTSFRLVSVPLPPLAAKAPQGKPIEFKATVYPGKEARR